MDLAMVDDKIVPIERAQSSCNDRGWSFGDGVYEVVLCSGGRAFAIERHMRRLAQSLEKMDMLEKVDLQEVRTRIERAQQQGQLDEGVIYLQITRGRQLREHDYGDDLQPSFFLTVTQRTGESEKTAKAITQPDLRWKRCDIKSLNLLGNVMAKHAASRAGAYEAILVDEAGYVTEGSSTSVLMVRDEVLQTAPLTANILPGITRELMLEWAEKVGLKVRTESFTVAEMLEADELMIAGTITQIRGVLSVDGKAIGDGRLGRQTARFGQMLAEAIRHGDG